MSGICGHFFRARLARRLPNGSAALPPDALSSPADSHFTSCPNGLMNKDTHDMLRLHFSPLSEQSPRRGAHHRQPARLADRARSWRRRRRRKASRAKRRATAASKAASAAAPAPPDGGWPRAYTTASGAALVIYQPQISSWVESETHRRLLGGVLHAEGRGQARARHRQGGIGHERGAGRAARELLGAQDRRVPTSPRSSATSCGPSWTRSPRRCRSTSA